jgi:hypothetical protein
MKILEKIYRVSFCNEVEMLTDGGALDRCIAIARAYGLASALGLPHNPFPNLILNDLGIDHPSSNARAYYNTRATIA